MAATIAGGQQILHLARSCDTLFSKCCEDVHILGDENFTKARLQHERFYLCTSYLGVFTEYKASLDKRLEHSSEIKNLVIQLLAILQVNLEFSKL